MYPWFLSLLNPGLPRWQWGESVVGHGPFQWPWLLTPSVLPDFGITEISHLYTHPLSLANEIFRGYTSIKINILTQKVRPRHKSGVSNCALGSAILPSPRWFGTAGGHHENFVSGWNTALKFRFYSKSERNPKKYCKFHEWKVQGEMKYFFQNTTS